MRLLIKKISADYLNLPPVKKEKDNYSFWTKYKKFAANEILLYLVMVLGIIAGIIVISIIKK